MPVLFDFHLPGAVAAGIFAGVAGAVTSVVEQALDPNQEVSLGKAAAVGITAGLITTVSVASVGVFTATAVNTYAVTTTNVTVHGAVAVARKIPVV